MQLEKKFEYELTLSVEEMQALYTVLENLYTSGIYEVNTEANTTTKDTIFDLYKIANLHIVN